MDKEQRDLLIALVRVERNRLALLRYEYLYDSKEDDKIWEEICICNRTLGFLKGRASYKEVSKG